MKLMNYVHAPNGLTHMFGCTFYDSMLLLFDLFTEFLMGVTNIPGNVAARAKYEKLGIKTWFGPRL